MSRPVQAQSCVQTCEISHARGMLRAASMTCGHRTSPTHPSPSRLKGHPPQGVTDVPSVQQVLYTVCWQGWRYLRGNTLLPPCRGILECASSTKKTLWLVLNIAMADFARLQLHLHEKHLQGLNQLCFFFYLLPQGLSEKGGWNPIACCA